jgi:hypothetical protein
VGIVAAPPPPSLAKATFQWGRQPPSAGLNTAPSAVWVLATMITLIPKAMYTQSRVEGLLAAVEHAEAFHQT